MLLVTTIFSALLSELFEKLYVDIFLSFIILNVGSHKKVHWKIGKIIWEERVKSGMLKCSRQWTENSKTTFQEAPRDMKLLKEGIVQYRIEKAFKTASVKVQNLKNKPLQPCILVMN